MSWLALSPEGQRQRKARRRGACVRCGRRAKKGHTRCQMCLDAAAAWEREHYQSAGKKQKRCFICGELGHNRTRHRRPL